jgi:hypothetical protein
MNQKFHFLRSAWLCYLGGSLLVALFLLLIPQGQYFCLQYQQDFKAYYYGAWAWRLGLDPYSQIALSQVSGISQPLTYAYLPFTLPLFSLFTLISLKHALYVYFLIKMLFLGWLLYILRNCFAPMGKYSTWLIFLVFAFSSALFRDIIVGNVTIIEQSFLWTGLALFLRKNYLFFTVCIVLASLFKISPILFLILLFFEADRTKFWYLSCGFITFAIFILSNFLFTHELFQHFIISLENMDERGQINPATLSLLRDVIDILRYKYGWMIPGNTTTLFYGVIVFLLASATLWGMLRISRSKLEDKSLILILFFTVGYSLILPRFKDYTYIILLLPTYYIALKGTRMRSFLPLLVLVGLPYSWNVRLFWEYISLFLTFALFALYHYEFNYKFHTPPMVAE